MSGQFDAEIVNSLGALMARAQQAERAVKGTDKAVADLAKRLKATDPRMMSQLARESKLAENEVNHVGHALARMGGPLGEVLHHLTGARGLTPGLVRVAAAAAVAGIAMRLFMSVTNANVARAREAAQAFREMSNAIQSGEKAQRSQALGAIGQKKDIGLLRALGGQEAVERADAVAANGEMDAGTARHVVAKAYLIKNEQARSSAINVAQQVASNGGDAENAIDEIVKDKRLQRKLAPTDQEVQQALTNRTARSREDVVDNRESEVANRVFSKQVGRKYSGLDNQRLRDQYQFGADAYTRAATGSQGVLNQRDAVGRKQLADDGTVAAREELAKFAAPVAAAITELARARQQELDTLQKMAEAEGQLVGALKNFELPFGGEGSASQQKRRKQIAFGEGG